MKLLLKKEKIENVTAFSKNVSTQPILSRNYNSALFTSNICGSIGDIETIEEHIYSKVYMAFISRKKL